MALQTQLLELPMQGSLAEDVDARVLPPGGWLRLDDVQIDKRGSWHKRPGFAFLGYPASLPSTQAPSARYEHPIFPWPDGVKLYDQLGVGVVGPTLFGVWCSLTAAPEAPVLATYRYGGDDETGTWEAKDQAPVFSLSRTCEVRSSRQITGACSVAIGRVLWTAYKTDGEKARVYLRGVDLETGSVVQDDVFFFELAGRYQQFVLLAIDGRPVALYEHQEVPP